MNKIKSVFVIFAVVLCFSFLFGVTVSAASYTRVDVPGETTELRLSRDSYSAVKAITAETLGLSENLTDISDICTLNDGKILIITSKKSKIIRLNADYTLDKDITVTDNMGDQIKFEGAKSIYGDKNGNIYISDTANARVLVTDSEGRLERILNVPESQLIPEDFVYQPTTVEKDLQGYLYIASVGCYYGVLMYSPEEEFLGFYASNTVSASALDTQPRYEDNKLLHIDGNNDNNNGYIYKKVEGVEAGKYVASFAENGYLLNNKVLFDVRTGTDAIPLVNTSNPTYTEDNLYSGFYDVEINEKTDVYIGFRIAPSVMSTVDMYLGELKLQPKNIDGTLGENLATVIANPNDWYYISGSAIKKINFDVNGIFELPGKEEPVYRLSLVDKNKQNFPVAEEMLHIKYNGTSSDSLIKEIPIEELTVGESYTVSFNSNFMSRALNEGVYFGVFAGLGDNGKSWQEVLFGSSEIGDAFSGESCNGLKNEYTFKFTEKKYEKYYIGFYIDESETAFEAYLSDLKFYKTKDSKKVNLLSEKGDWYSDFAVGDDVGLADSKFVEYDRYKLINASSNSQKQKTMFNYTTVHKTSHQMRIKLDKSKLEPYKEYVFSFKYRFVNIDLDNGATFVLFAETQNPNHIGDKNLYSSSALSQNFKKMFSDGVNGEYVMELSQSELNVYKEFYIGFNFIGKSEEIQMNIADFIMYEAGDPEKKNMLPKDSYSTDTYGWYNYTIEMTPNVSARFGISYIPYDSSIFKKEMNITGDYDVGDRVAVKLNRKQLTAESEYKVSFDYNLSNLELDKDIYFAVFGDKDSSDSKFADTLIYGYDTLKYLKIDSGKSDRTYNFKLTREMLNDYADIYVGLYFGRNVKSADLHIFDFNVTNLQSGITLFEQAQYNPRIYGWYTEKEKLGAHQVCENIKFVFYNGQLYPKYVFSELDDGEWWNAEDVKPFKVKNDAIFKGTLIGADGKPVTKTTLYLVSDNKTYETYTNSKGNFSFNNIEEGFYQLYMLGGNGDKISLEYGVTIENGAVVTVNINMENIYEEEIIVTDVGTVRGNVYTAKLDVVKGLKIYLRSLGEIVTDKNGYFEFVDVPIGNYELYTVLENGTEYSFKTVEIKKNIDLQTKLKFDPPSSKAVDANEDGNGLLVWILIIATVVAVGGLTVAVILLINRKKKSILKVNP